MEDLVLKLLEDALKFKENYTTHLAGRNNIAIISIQSWLSYKFKIIITAVPFIDPKYPERLLWYIDTKEWSRTHNVWLNKNQSVQFYDSYLEALVKGLLAGVEIAKFKEDGITTSK